MTAVVAVRVATIEGVKEQEIIRQYFTFPTRRHVLIGVGDDAAVVQPPPADMATPLAIGTDTLVEGTHFLPDTPPRLLARKAAAVSLSDLAAMGATPLWMTVALTAPPTAATWFADFAEGLKSSEAEHDYAVVGGDLTRGDRLSVTTTAIGAQSAPPLTRGGARDGDDVWLSGTTGEAAFALGVLTGQWRGGDDDKTLAAATRRLHDPTPRLTLGQALTAWAGAAMDLSDGLLTAARAIAAMSGVGVTLQLAQLPVADCFAGVAEDIRWRCLLNGGDDYELLFTAPAAHREKIAVLQTGAALTRIGEVGGEGLRLMLNGEPCPDRLDEGYEHDFDA